MRGNLLYNAVRIGNILGNAKESGTEFPPKEVSRVSPLCHGHVIVNGIYDFTGAIRRSVP